MLGLGVLFLAGILVAFAIPRLAAIGTLREIGRGADASDGTLRSEMGWLRAPRVTGFVRVLEARPPGPGPHPVLVFVHGVAVKGLDDARVIHAVGAFRDAGFLVLAPQVQVLVSPPESDRDLERLAQLFTAIAEGRVRGADARHVGVVGVSVGGGLALRAVARARRQGATGPRAILTIGAPDDLRRIMPDWFSLARPDDTVRRTFQQVRRDEARFARNVVFRAALGARVDDPRERAVLRRLLEAELDPTFCPTGLESAPARAFASLVGGTPATWKSIRHDLVEDAWPLMQVFSPAASGPELRGLAGVLCFLLHGEQDPLVPVSELQQLARRLRAVTPTVALASRMLGHVDVASVGIDEQAAHVVFLDDFFDAVGR